ncbi:hypothetical protein OF83DRAFT_1173911 [Amylostereum chailletii]|nr:hypothetical protein OF83DRAFT_1173911 [Amylostereum chailletii]
MQRELVTHLHDDAERLPRDMQRVAYDADRTQYYYRDQHGAGATYVGRPGEEYGVMVPEHEAAENVPSRGLGRKPTLPAYKRPVRFADDSGESDDDEHTARAHPPTHPYGPGPGPGAGHTKAPSHPAYSQPDASHHAHYGTGMTFADILPSNLLASAPPMDAPKSPVKRALTLRHGPSASDPGAHAHARREGRPEKNVQYREPASPRKKSFQGAAKMVGRAAMAFGKKEKREEREKEAWGVYQRVD